MKDDKELVSMGPQEQSGNEGSYRESLKFLYFFIMSDLCLIGWSDRNRITFEALVTIKTIR